MRVLRKRSSNKWTPESKKKKSEKHHDNLVRRRAKANIPRCLLCKEYPPTAHDLAVHLNKVHKTTLKSKGVYLVCECGLEVHSHRSTSNNPECADCVGYSVRKFLDAKKRTPQCVLCEVHPASAAAYCHHVKSHHKSTLKASGIFIICSCDIEIRSHHDSPSHNAQCMSNEFKVKRIKDVVVEDMDGEEEEEEEGEEMEEEEIEDAEQLRENADDVEEAMEEDENDEEEVEIEEGRERVMRDEEHMIEEEEELDDESEDDVDGDKEKVVESKNEEMEDPDEYKEGGYHPVRIGDVLNGKYEVKEKLGWGSFSTVWSCKEMNKKRRIALKIIKSDHTQAANHEITILKCIRGKDSADPRVERIVRLLDSFSVTGENGTHVCMAFEKLDCDLFKLTKSNRNGLEIEKVKMITRQMLEGLDYLHTKCKIIHTDIKPENVLVKRSHNTIELKIADLGSACWIQRNLRGRIRTLEYSALEAIIGAGFGAAADIWSAACTVFELATGNYLFDPKRGDSEEDDLLDEIVKLLGPIPSAIIKTGRHWKKFFSEEGELLGRHVAPFPMMDVLKEKRGWSHSDALQFNSFLTPMFQFDQEKRATAAQCLQHDWLQLGPHGGGEAGVDAEGEEMREEEDGEHQGAGEGAEKVTSRSGQPDLD